MGGITRKKQREKREALARLTAPQHLTTTHFLEHRKVEGYEQDREVHDFYGCDRLWKLETMYGRVQMGYDPKKGQSFLFANLKTSIYNNAASREQRKMNERERMKTLKTGTQNIAYSARRRAGSTVLVYKAENKPWSEASVAPYLGRVNLETLAQTMPFLVRGEHAEAAEARREYRRLDKTRNAQSLAQQTQLSHWVDRLEAIFLLKEQQSRLFFRRLNTAIDLQKAKMFEYYRNVKKNRARAAQAVQGMKPNEESGDGEERTDN